MTRNRRPSRTARRRHTAGYRVNVPKSLAALIVGDPELDDDTTKLLAHSVMWVFRQAADPRFAAAATDDPDEFVTALRNLHDRGWISVFDGEAHLSEPVYGPLGNVVDRVRMTATDRRAFAQICGDSLLDEMGEAAG